MKTAPSSHMLFAAAERRGYQPEWFTDYGFFSILLEGKRVPFHMTYSTLNSQIWSRLTRDKYACRQWLQLHDFSNIPYCFTTQRSEANQFLDAQGSVVAKPVLGERGVGVQKITNHAELAEIDLSLTLLEKYVSGMEYRVLLLQGEVIGIQQKSLDPSNEHPWRKKRSNLDIKSFPTQLVSLSKDVQRVVPQGLLAVDWLVDADEQPWVLELNSAPGLWSFAHPHEGKALDFSDQILLAFVQAAQSHA